MGRYRRCNLVIVLAVIGLAACASATAPVAHPVAGRRHPNILVVLTDDLNLDEMSRDAARPGADR